MIEKKRNKCNQWRKLHHMKRSMKKLHLIMKVKGNIMKIKENIMKTKENIMKHKENIMKHKENIMKLNIMINQKILKRHLHKNINKKEKEEER